MRWLIEIMNVIVKTVYFLDSKLVVDEVFALVDPMDVRVLYTPVDVFVDDLKKNPRRSK